MKEYLEQNEKREKKKRISLSQKITWLSKRRQLSLHIKADLKRQVQIIPAGLLELANFWFAVSMLRSRPSLMPTLPVQGTGMVRTANGQVAAEKIEAEEFNLKAVDKRIKDGFAAILRGEKLLLSKARDREKFLKEYTQIYHSIVGEDIGQFLTRRKKIALMLKRAFKLRLKIEEYEREIDDDCEQLQDLLKKTLRLAKKHETELYRQWVKGQIVFYLNHRGVIGAIKQTYTHFEQEAV